MDEVRAVRDKDLEDLSSWRRELARFCDYHVQSLLYYLRTDCEEGATDIASAATADGFRGFWEYDQEALSATADEPLHLTSSTAVIDSLLGVPMGPPSWRSGRRAPARALAGKFAALALGADLWETQGGASLFTCCRTLPLVARFADPDQLRALRERLAFVVQNGEWMGATPSTFGVTASTNHVGSKLAGSPPTIYHLYWALGISQAFVDEHFDDLGPQFRSWRDRCLGWANEQLARQVAFHSAKSDWRDPNVLGWAIAIQLAHMGPLRGHSQEADLVRAGFQHFFDAQLDSGDWPPGKPVLHTPRSGNVYSYPYQLLGCILKVAAEADPFLASELRQYASHLRRTFDLACRTVRRVGPGGSCWGWVRDGHTDSCVTEAWATASVFDFGQHLRKLVAVWTREAVLQPQMYMVPLATPDSRAAGLSLVRGRGDTWPASDGLTIADQLISLFVNPIRLTGRTSNSGAYDPDGSLFTTDQARAAILFGPPGTSKTTLARGVAESVGWDFLEIPVTDFVAKGIPHIQQQADRIFRDLTHTTRCVVLFDEIDELVRSRDDGDAEVFGRFLTTSMLPKLAALWSTGQVVYFVATNHLGFFDAAITRSQRFDAALFVGTPSLERKEALLAEALLELSGGTAGGNILDLDDSITTGAMGELLREAKDSFRENVKNPEERLHQPWLSPAKLCLLRYDQMKELAVRVWAQHTVDGGMDEPMVHLSKRRLGQALDAIADDRLARWKTLATFEEDRHRQHIDEGRIRVWSVEYDSDEAKSQFESRFHAAIVPALEPGAHAAVILHSLPPNPWRVDDLVIDRSRKGGALYVRRCS